MDLLSVPSRPTTSFGLDPAALATQAGNRNPSALDAIASGFEGLFVSLLVKQMRQTLEPGALFSDDPSDILGGLFDHTMGQHLSQAGALGIGAMLRQQLAQRYNA